ncbi:type IX secretion system protein PorD [Flavobacterium sp. C4GT6]|uniref:type IX secretion system protein PorD n=1 Tax=Flavobacterium sp. C4GT6 TaxID=3103818 RepID=UPI002ED17C21
MYRYLGLLLLLLSFSVKGQELNATVQVNYSQITDANTQIFKTLETSVTEFVNNTRFTNRNFERNERIDCVFFINITAYQSNSFDATLQVQSSRPVYNSSYLSPVLNFNDKNFGFSYTEFQNMVYNPESYTSNLISVISFYANMIIGMDADTYEFEGGTPYYDVAQRIASAAQQSGYKGWSQQDGNQNRYFLINDMLSNTYRDFRQALYDYHRLGMDIMADNSKEGKEKIIAAINTLSKVNKARPNAFLTRVFFDAKSDEVVSIFSAGPMVTLTGLVDTLNKISPLNSAKWSTIK